MTDGVTDEEFAEALDEAKAEGNLSRANVVRKLRKQPGPTTRLDRGGSDPRPCRCSRDRTGRSPLPCPPRAHERVPNRCP